MVAAISDNPTTTRGRPPAFDELIRKTTAHLFPEATGRMFYRRCSSIRTTCAVDGQSYADAIRQRPQGVLESLGLLESDDLIREFAAYIVANELNNVDAVKMVRIHRNIEKPTATTDELKAALITFLNQYRERNEIELDAVADALASVAITVERMID